MESHRSRPAAPALVLTALLLALAVVPAAEGSEVSPTRLFLGFHEYPLALAEGDEYDGAPIVRAIPEIRALAVTTYEPLAFTQRQLADPNVRYVVNDDPIPLLLEDVRREAVPTPDGVMPMLTPNDPQYASMYGPQQTRANLAWDTTTGDMDAAVCVIDTGVRKTHEDLGTARYLGGYDFVNSDTDPNDDQGHGTHVAGTAVGAIGNALGVAGMGNTGYYSVKVLNSAGSGSWSNVAAGITWCANNGIPRTVLSLSLGGTGFDQGVADAVHYAYANKGMLVAAASGNGYCDNCVIYPGALPEAIGVACTNSAQVSCDFTSKGPQVDVAAPGEGILSTCYGSDTQYCTKSGTSMSTPHVSGILALVWSHETSLTASQLWERLNTTSKDLGAPGKDNAFGWGRIDAYCLITNTLCSLPPPPQFPFHIIDFEGSASLPPGWTTTGLWHLSTCKASSGLNSLAYNKAGCPTNYDTGAANSGEATSPPVVVPNTLAASLKIKSRFATESGTTWDKKLVQISANGGPFTQAFQEAGAQNTWNDITIDLTGYAGQEVRVRFRFDTVDASFNNYEGWYVDDITFLTADLGNATPPSAPLDLNATAGPGAGQIRLTWSAPADLGGAPVATYRVYRSANAAGPYVLVGTATSRTFTDSNLSEGSTHHYQVSAVNVAGEGPQSVSASATTFKRPTEPRNLDAKPGGALFSIDLVWQAPLDNGGTPVTSYKIYRNNVSVGTTTALSYRDSNLDPTRVYHYKVAAVNVVGEGPRSNDACSRANPWPQLLQATCEI